jgi:hypothetical protein
MTVKKPQIEIRASRLVITGKAMDHALDFTLAFLAQQLCRLLCAVTFMYYQRKLCLPRQTDELCKNLPLNFTRRMILIIVQTGFAYSDHLWVSGEFF